MKKLKIGIIGCGGIANQKHFPALKANGELNEIVAFCDIATERAEQAAKEYGTKAASVYSDYKELLKDVNVEVIHICTPNVSHSKIAVAAFEAGKHVYCEKPMSHSTIEAEKMLAAWKKSGKKFTVGYQNRFREEVQNLHASCEKGELGEVYYGKAHAVRRRGVPTWGVFPDKSQQGGGPLIDIGTHALDITLWCMNNYEIDRVSGSVFYKLGHLQQATEGNLFGAWDPNTYEVEDSAMGFIHMKDGATIHLEASWALNLLESREASTTLCGTLGGAEIHSGMSHSKNELIYNRGRNGQLMEEKLSPVGGVAYFGGGGGEEGVIDCKQWLIAILEDKEPLVQPNEAFTVTKILEAIYQSAEKGKEIKF
ncbi:Gfo/Idh/MocA family protein [Anaerosacchariphilus polymeriproducens]|uniref:Gfo/Idh/MocA family oxidoreductase n=1 Tax=Anaerosacchariphilus polymeriproducens TaxID=1812858 RepID=A0A371AYI1_9FIRM|nr:Gfo/Idh/MocA family oxidoreductase [Anaerosacchariphilus polymeriproducens]RDU24621.1 gfo/Idh/MocA family oxidoreductase [Anaerosacchariphilus polymeriproducens]